MQRFMFTPHFHIRYNFSSWHFVKPTPLLFVKWTWLPRGPVRLSSAACYGVAGGWYHTGLGAAAGNWLVLLLAAARAKQNTQVEPGNASQMQRVFPESLDGASAQTESQEASERGRGVCKDPTVNVRNEWKPSTQYEIWYSAPQANLFDVPHNRLFNSSR